MSEPARKTAECASAGQAPESSPAARAPARDDGAARPRPGDRVELQVESLAFGGEGVARLGEGGYVVFVAGAIPGDRVRAVVYKRKRSHAHALRPRRVGERRVLELGGIAAAERRLRQQQRLQASGRSVCRSGYFPVSRRVHDRAGD